MSLPDTQTYLVYLCSDRGHPEAEPEHYRIRTVERLRGWGAIEFSHGICDACAERTGLNEIQPTTREPTEAEIAFVMNPMKLETV